jgi:hypothetical protein
MASEKFANNAITQLSGAITSGAVSLTVADASAFPGSGQFRILIDSEVMLVTAVAGNTFTVTRNAESVGGGSGAAAHAALAQVSQVLTDAALRNDPRAMTSTGDLEYLDSSGAVTRLGIGSANQVITVSGGLPIWSTLVSVGTLTSGATGAGFTIALSTSTVTGTLPAANLPTSGAIGASPANFYQAGNVYPAGIVGYTPVNSALMSANTIVFTPFFSGQAQAVTALVCTVHTGAVGKNVRMGLYKGDGSGGKPSTLVADGGSSSANPGADTDVSQTISATLAANTLYWLCIVSDGGPTLWGIPQTAVPVTPIGVVKVGSGTMNQAPSVGYTASFTFGALPNPWTATLTPTASGPAVGLKF